MGISPKELWAMGAEQVDLLIAHDELAKDIGPHGHPMSEATSPDADPNNYAGGYRYVAHPKVDQAQRAILDAQKTMKAQVGDADTSDIVYSVEKVDY